MKIRVPVYDNPNDFKIFLLIEEGKNYNEILAKELKVKPSTLIERLQYLERYKYLSSKEEKKKFNRKIYSVNFKSLALLFLTQIKKDASLILKSHTSSYFSNERKEEIKKEIERHFNKIKDNKFLPFCIKSFFKTIIINSKFEEKIIILDKIKNLKEMFIIMASYIIGHENFIKSYPKESHELVENFNKMLDFSGLKIRMEKGKDELIEKLLNTMEQEYNSTSKEKDTP